MEYCLRRREGIIPPVYNILHVEELPIPVADHNIEVAEQNLNVVEVDPILDGDAELIGELGEPKENEYDIPHNMGLPEDEQMVHGAPNFEFIDMEVASNHKPFFSANGNHKPGAAKQNSMEAVIFVPYRGPVLDGNVEMIEDLGEPKENEMDIPPSAAFEQDNAPGLRHGDMQIAANGLYRRDSNDIENVSNDGNFFEEPEIKYEVVVGDLSFSPTKHLMALSATIRGL